MFISPKKSLAPRSLRKKVTFQTCDRRSVISVYVIKSRFRQFAGVIFTIRILTQTSKNLTRRATNTHVNFSARSPEKFSSCKQRKIVCKRQTREKKNFIFRSSSENINFIDFFSFVFMMFFYKNKNQWDKKF